MQTRFQLELYYSIKTMQASFTTFAATTILAPTKMDHIAIITVDAESIHLAKMWLLNQTCTGVNSTELLQPLPATSVAFLKEKEAFAPKGGKERSHSKGREDKVLEGAISCLFFGERCAEVPDPELFIGFESGAVGMFRVFVINDKKSSKDMKIQAVKMFSC